MSPCDPVKEGPKGEAVALLPKKVDNQGGAYKEPLMYPMFAYATMNVKPAFRNGSDTDPGPSETETL
jgi:hypothetical protein